MARSRTDYESLMNALRRRPVAVGPDMAASSPAGFGLNWKPQPQTGQSLGASAIGAGAGLLSALILRNASQPSLPKPKPLGANLSSPDYGNVDFYARGGTLRRDGQVAVVGEDEPEIALHENGQTHIIPLDRAARLGDAVGALSPPQPRPAASDMMQRAGAPVVAAPQPAATHDPREQANVQRLLAMQDGAGAIPQPQQPAPVVPMTGKVKAAPDAGVEEEEQRRLAERLAQYPQLGEVPPGERSASVEGAADALTLPGDVRPGYDTASATRPRFADEVGRLDSQIDYDTQHPAQDENGRGRSIAMSAIIGALEGAKSGDWRNAVAGAGAGAAAGAIDKSFDERTKQQYRVGGYKQQFADALKRRESALDLEGKKADVRYKNAQAGYYETTKKEEAAARLLQRERSSVMANLRLLRGQKLDPAHPRHAALLEKAAGVGVVVDPDAWNNSASNLAPVELIDPANPTQKRRGFVNKATGELSDVGPSNYVQPVNPETGMTAAQEAAAEDRKKRLALSEQLTSANLRRLDALTRLYERDLAGVSPGEKRAFDVETKGLPEAVKAKRGEVEKLRKQILEGRIDDVKGNEAIDKLTGEIDALEDQLEGARERARSGAGRARGSRSASATYTEADVRARAKASGKDPAEAVKAARAAGLIK